MKDRTLRSSRLLIPADVIARASYYLAFVRLEPDVMAASMEQPKLAARTVPCAPTFQYQTHTSCLNLGHMVFISAGSVPYYLHLRGLYQMSASWVNTCREASVAFTMNWPRVKSHKAGGTETEELLELLDNGHWRSRVGCTGTM